MNDSVHLLSVVGISPAVVTETIWALTAGADEDSRVAVTSVTIVTTSVGQKRMAPVLELELDRMRELFPKLASSFPSYDKVVINVPRRPDGTPISDVRDAQDGASMADEIFEVVRKATSKPTRVHASIAGGRKTMGYHMGNAMQFFARASDRMSHVLVDSPADMSRDFFFPYPERGTVMQARDTEFDPADIEVELQEIPFVRLREKLETEDLPTSHWDLIAAAQEDLYGDAALVINFLQNQATYAGERLFLTSVQFAIFSFIAWEKTHGNTPLSSGNLVDGGAIALKLMTFNDIIGEVDDSFLNWIRKTDPDSVAKHKNNLRSQLGLLRSALNRNFPETIVRKLAPASDGKGYDIGIDISRIDFVGLEYMRRQLDEFLPTQGED